MDDFAELIREISECSTSSESPGMASDDEQIELTDKIIMLAREWMEKKEQTGKPAEPDE